MGFPKEAQEILNEGFVLAEEKGLKELSTKISKERVILENEIKKWEKDTKANLSLPDRLNQAEIKSYINRAMKVLGRI